MLKSRLQDQRPIPETGKLPYSGMIDCGMQIVRKVGHARDGAPALPACLPA